MKLQYTFEGVQYSITPDWLFISEKEIIFSDEGRRLPPENIEEAEIKYENGDASKFALEGEDKIEEVRIIPL